MATIQYGIKDILTNEYFKYHGRGSRCVDLSWVFNIDIDVITLYSKPNACKAFINSYNAGFENRNNKLPTYRTDPPIKRDLVVIQIETTNKELY